MSTIISFITKPKFNGKTIFYNAIVEYHYEDGHSIGVHSKSLEFYGDGMVFANEFLAVVNKNFGTDYPYDESYKNEVGKKHGNNSIHKCFELRDSWGDKFELLHRYDYDDVKGCVSTYGDFSKSDLIAFADAVADYNKNGVVNNPTDFHPTYKLTDKLAEAEKEHDNNLAEVIKQNEVAKEALAKGGLNGVAFENAVKNMEIGIRMAKTSLMDKWLDAKRNIHLEGLELVLNIILPKIPIYQTYFTKEICVDKRDTYYSSDDRYRTWCGIRVDGKNYGYYAIIPYEVNDNLFFKFEGEITKTKENFDLHSLTYETLMEVIKIYNDMFHKSIWGNAKLA